MAIFLFSTNMQLKKLVEDATSWWAEWDYNFDRIDTHDHSPNKGKQLAGASLTANDDYYFGSVTINQDPNKNFILLGKKSADPNPAIPTGRGYVYTKQDAAGKTNLFYYDEDRNVIQLTREGSLVSGPVRVWDIAKAYELKLTWNETAVADEALNFKVNAGNRTLDLTGNLTVGANSTINQNVSTTAKPAFSGIELSEMAAPATPTNAGVLYVTTSNDLHYVKEDGVDVAVTLGGSVNTSAVDATTTFLLNIKSDSTPNFTANHDLTLDLANASRAFTISGDSAINQDMRSSASPTFVTPSLTSLKLRDSALDNTLEIKSNEDLAANRILNLVVGAADRAITLGGDLSVTNTSSINQDVQSSAAPSFAGITLTASAASLTWVLKDNDASALSIGSAGATDMMKFVTTDTAEAIVFADDKARSASNAAPVDATSFTNKKYVDDQILAHDTFLELTDTPASYANSFATYRINAGKTGLEETTILLSEPATNQFQIEAGTSAALFQADLTVSGSSTINQDVSSSASPTFVKPHLSSGIELEDPGVGTNKITLQAPTLAGDYSLTLPVDDGSVGNVLITDGSGNLSWAMGSTPSIPDFGTGFNLGLASNSNPDFTADRVLTFDLANAARTIIIDGSSAINQDVRSSSSPTFVKPHLTSGIEIEDPGVGTNKVTLQAPTLSGDYSLTLPGDDGTANQILKTDGSGVLGWTDQQAPEWTDASTSYKLTMASDSRPDFTAARALTWDLGDAARTLQAGGLSRVLNDELYLTSADFPNTTTLYGWHLNQGTDAATIPNWAGTIDLTRNGALTQQADHLGNSVYCEFDGTNDWLSSTDAAFNFTGTFSLGCWAYSSNWSGLGSESCLISRYGGGATGWFFYITGSTKALGFWADSVTIEARVLNTLSPGWHHFAMSRTVSGQTYFYIDRKWVSTNTSPTITAAGNLNIGARAGGSNRFAGRISEVAIHNGTAWAENDVAKAYARGARRFAALDQNGSIQIPQNETIYYPQRTLTTSGPAGWSPIGAYGIPYTDILGNWRLRFNITGTITGASTNVWTLAITGVTFKNTANFFQAVCAFPAGAAGGQWSYGQAQPGTGNIIIGTVNNIAATYLEASGDLLLNSQPTI